MHLSGFNRPTFIIITNLQPLVADKHIHSTSDFPHHDSPTALFSFFSFPPSFSHHYFYLCQINIPFTFSFTTTPHHEFGPEPGQLPRVTGPWNRLWLRHCFVQALRACTSQFPVTLLCYLMSFCIWNLFFFNFFLLISLFF